MKKMLALLCAVLTLSLVVVARAETAVTLSIQPRAAAQGSAKVTFDVYLTPNGQREIGVLQFSLTGEGCTITGVELDAETAAQLTYDSAGGTGAFALYGGSLHGGVCTFAAAGTSAAPYTADGTAHPAHIWRATERVRLATVTASADPDAAFCSLTVERGGDRKLTVGSGQTRYAVSVESAAQLLPAGGQMGDVNGDGVIDRADADLVYEFYLGRAALTDTQRVRGDMDRSGETDDVDAAMLYGLVNGAIKDPDEE